MVCIQSYRTGELHPGGESKDVASLDLEAAKQLIIQLQASLQARELQLERKQEEVASMQDTTQQVMVSVACRAGTNPASSHDWVLSTDTQNSNVGVRCSHLALHNSLP